VKTLFSNFCGVDSSEVDSHEIKQTNKIQQQQQQQQQITK